MLIDLSRIQKQLATAEVLEAFVKKMAPHQGCDLGFDTETYARTYPDDVVAGISLFNPMDLESIYVPLGHKEEFGINVSWDVAHPLLQSLLDAHRPIFHNGFFDMIRCVKKGLRFSDTGDSYILANMLQFLSLSLKDLVLETGLVEFGKVMPYRALIQKVFQVAPAVIAEYKEESDFLQAYPFGNIDVSKVPEALNYACNDSILVYYLLADLVIKYTQKVGNFDKVQRILEAQNNTQVLLAESCAFGFQIDPKLMDSVITQLDEDSKRLNSEVCYAVRVAMGWIKPDPTIEITEEGLEEVSFEEDDDE